MKYKQGLNIGHCEGTIQCTYAVIYSDPYGTKKLFALQRRNFADKWNLDNSGNEGYDNSNPDNFTLQSSQGIITTYTGFGAEGIIGWDMRGGTKGATWGAATGMITFDMPLVLATEHSNARFVPVTLLEDAVMYIRRTLNNDNIKHYREHWAELASRIQSGTTVYVKPAAFNWQPINLINSVDKNGIPISEKVQVSKEKLDKARRALILAGASNLL